MKTTLTLLFIFCPFLLLFSQVTPIGLESDNIRLNAFLYQTEKKGHAPVIIWCHGNPGGKETGESSFAIALAKKGFHVLRFNYRGLWGNKGEYTPGNCSRDLKSAIAFVLDKENARKYRIDTTRLVVGGYSHGSNVTITTAMYDDRINEIILMGLADFGYLIRETFNPYNTKMKKFNQEVKDAIWGEANWGEGKYARDYDKYVFDILFNNYRYDYVAQAERLAGKRMYFILGMNDETVPVEDHFFPLYRKLKAMDHQNFEYVITNSDHSFRDISNEEKAGMIVNWLNKE